MSMLATMSNQTAENTESPRSDAIAPLSVRELTVAYRQKAVLWDVNFDMHPASLTAIVGPNGAGKSTLMKAVLGLLTTRGGRARFWDQKLKDVRGRVAYVPQRTSVDWDFPVTAQQVVAMGLYRQIGWLRPVTRKYKQMADAALERVGLSGLGDRQISQLSGGQQQRVFLARALVQDADLYLMDEPLAGVDAATERAIIELLRELRSEGKAALVVHHDLNTVTDYFDHLLLLNMRVIAAGAMDETFTVENLRQTYGSKLTLLDEVGNRMVTAGGRP
ncbi:metal ABC transporter ATP-binding protein [Calycomorphotria hydatis]|uniref:Zinc import ATP-binding protein ZnuC n=1 Tax=Calycomorphotria hydatis TaxID=2528027 RepID=A0A517T531_9PLAN|nr:metal ABC transporter ATP-binding protein [Calycomorphotria hydatis]QDT63478.1 Zinc import ATP-binding protein ZnuC [Calycomorphotria hydatis]